jgi:GTP-binding protein Era
MIFLDTPGLLEPSYRLHETMSHQIERSAREADVVLLLIDATRLDDRLDLIRRFLSSPLKGQVVVAVNKVDRLDNSAEMEAIRARVARSLELQTVIAISALKGYQLDGMMAELESHLPLGPQLYPDEMVAEQPERFFTAELIRESAFNQLVDELPYSIEVVIEEFREGDRAAGDDSAVSRVDGSSTVGKAYIAATIYVERDSQKGIVIGHKGSRLRSIGRQARLQIEALLEQAVYLDLRVKVRLDWRNRARDLREFGYE